MKCKMGQFKVHNLPTQSSMVAYHNFAKALKNVEQLLITGGLLEVAYKQCPCGLWVELIYPPIQRPELIFTFCF